MVIELYNRMLLKYKLYPTYSICTIYNKIMDRKNNPRNNLMKSNQSGFGNSMLNNTLNNTKKLNNLNSNPYIISNATNPKAESNAEKINRAKSINANNPINNNSCCFHSNDEEIHDFRQRSIRSKYDESDISDIYHFLDMYPCVECQSSIDLYNICRNFKDMNKDLEWALCNNCHTKILPKLRIKYLDKKQSLESQKLFPRRESVSSLNSEHYMCDESEVLYSPFHLKYNFYNSSFIESRLKLDIDYFKIKFNALFWNSIWYFRIKDLPYDFLSPYKESPIERPALDRSIKDLKNSINKNLAFNKLNSIENLLSFNNNNIAHNQEKEFIKDKNNQQVFNPLAFNANANVNIYANNNIYNQSKEVKFIAVTPRSDKNSPNAEEEKELDLAAASDDQKINMFISNSKLEQDSYKKSIYLLYIIYHNILLLY